MIDLGGWYAARTADDLLQPPLPCIQLKPSEKPLLKQRERPKYRLMCMLWPLFGVVAVSAHYPDRFGLARNYTGVVIRLAPAACAIRAKVESAVGALLRIYLQNVLQHLFGLRPIQQVRADWPVQWVLGLRRRKRDAAIRGEVCG